VSHILLAVADLCSRALVMDGGRIAFDGPVADGIARYRELSAGRADADRTSAPGHELRINGEAPGDAITIGPNDPLDVELAVQRPMDAIPEDVELNLVVESPDGRMAMHLRNDLAGTVLTLNPGVNRLSIHIDDVSLVPRRYTLWLRLVGLTTGTPSIWDARVPMLVTGDQRLESIVQPRHHFGRG
jgi:hypothetical protein